MSADEKTPDDDTVSEAAYRSAIDRLYVDGEAKGESQPNDKAEAKSPDDEEAERRKRQERARASRAAALAQVKALNKKHFIVGNVGGKCLIGEFVPSTIDDKCTYLSLQTPAAFKTRYGNRKVGIEDEDSKSKTYKRLGQYWMEHSERLEYEGIDLKPNGPAVLPGNRLNLWHGFGVEPKQGKYPRLRWHLDNILANGDPRAAEYNWRWSAWSVQNPDKPAEAVLTFRGGEGVGKGVMGHVMRRIFGEHGLHISSPTHLTGNFNGHLESCLFVFADEAIAAEDKKSQSVSKAIVTEPVLIIERKNIDAYQVKNRLHIIIATNHEWAVAAAKDARRYVVNDVSSKRQRNKPYFDALFAELDDGGIEALLYDLLHTDLGSWHPREIYETKALQEQKLHSLSGQEEWLNAVLQEGVVPGRKPDQLDRAEANVLFDDARRRFSRLRSVTETAFGLFLGKHCTRCKVAEARGWQFPPLTEARKAWEQKIGGWTWDEPALKEWK